MWSWSKPVWYLVFFDTHTPIEKERMALILNDKDREDLFRLSSTLLISHLLWCCATQKLQHRVCALANVGWMSGCIRIWLQFSVYWAFLLKWAVKIYLFTLAVCSHMLFWVQLYGCLGFYWNTGAKNGPGFMYRWVVVGCMIVCMGEVQDVYV